ncbi:MAG: rod shape-determining protein MreC [Lentisphaerae bacterium]|nr:rod shape-determining protein MreC [Lentisphaerota bacterium]
MEKKTGIMLCACALAGAAILLWIAGGYAVASEAVYPLERSATWFQRNVTCRIRTLWRRQSYAAENVRLKREVELLRMVLGEMERTKPQAKRPVPAELGGWVQAPILSRNGATGAKNFLRVGKGSIHGVSEGSAVASPDGLVGIVSDVSLHTCTVKMITDPSVKVSCVLETGDPDLGTMYGIVSGTGTKTVSQTEAVVLYAVNPLYVGHLKNGFKPPPRTRIVTSGLGGIFPKGILVGSLVSSPRSDSTKLEQEGDVAPAVDFPALEEVFIRREN